MCVTSVSSRRVAATCIAMVVAALVFGGGRPIHAATQGGGGPPTAANPHWDASRCGDCHRAGNGAGPVNGVEADRLCLRCHDGRAASAEAHPVGRVVPKEQSLPSGWPLNNKGRVGCLTCHD